LPFLQAALLLSAGLRKMNNDNFIFSHTLLGEKGESEKTEAKRQKRKDRSEKTKRKDKRRKDIDI